MKNICLVSWIGLLSIVKLAAAPPTLVRGSGLIDVVMVKDPTLIPEGFKMYTAWDIKDVGETPQPLYTQEKDGGWWLVGIVYKNAHGRMAVGLNPDLPPEKARCYFVSTRHYKDGTTHFNAPFPLGGEKEPYVIIPQLGEKDSLHLIGAQHQHKSPPREYTQFEKLVIDGHVHVARNEVPRWAEQDDYIEFKQKWAEALTNMRGLVDKKRAEETLNIEAPPWPSTETSDRHVGVYNNERAAELMREANAPSKGGLFRKMKKAISFKGF